MGKLIDNLITAIGETKALPETAAQIVQYGFWYNLSIFTLSIVTLVIGFVVGWMLIKKSTEYHKNSDDILGSIYFVAGTVISAAMIVATSMFVFESPKFISNIIKTRIAPKVYIIDYLEKKLK